MVEVKVASDLFGVGGMAFVAMIDKGWPNPALEKLQVLFPGREFAHYPGPEYAKGNCRKSANYAEGVVFVGTVVHGHKGSRFTFCRPESHLPEAKSVVEAVPF